MMGTHADVDADLPTSTDKDVDLPTPPELESWEQLSDMRLFILVAAFFALWAGNSSSVLQTATVLPVIQKEFGVSRRQVQWVAASNTIVWGSSQIVAGRCCDIYGRKRAFHCGMLLFVLPTIVSAFMPNLAALNVCRGIVGAGAAVIIPAAAGMIGSIYPPGRKRTFAFVAVSCGGVSGASIGMLIAGALLEYSRWTWRPCYLVIAIMSLGPWSVITWLVPVDPPKDKDTRLDWLGSTLMGISLFLLLFGSTSSQTEKDGWRTTYVPALIGGSIVFMIFFVLRQIQLTKALASGTKARPLIPRALLSIECWNLLVIYVAAACTWASTDTMWTLLSYLYLDVLELGALDSGLRLSVCLFSGLAAASIVALTINRIPPRALMAALCSIATLSLVLLAIRKVNWPFWRADLWAMLLAGFNAECLVAVGLTLISMTAPIKDGSIATAIFQTSCRIGYAIGLAVATLIQENVESRALDGGANSKEALARGLSAGFWFCAGCAGAAALVILFGMRGWQMLSEMKQGGEEPEEGVDLTAGPSTNAQLARARD